MPFRSALELTLDSIGLKEARHALSKDSPETTRAAYAVFISHSKGPIRIVAGEADSQLFEREDFISSVRGVLACGNNTFSLVFHRCSDRNAASESLASSNAKLVALKSDFGDRVHLYWSPIRPLQHYAIITLMDSCQALLEEPKHEGEQPFWATPVYDKAECEDWARRFDTFIQSCRELDFDSQSSS